MDKKSISTFIILIAVVITIILFINYLKKDDNSNASKEEMLCIAENSKLIVSVTCGHCTDQKKILKDNLEDYENYFELLEILENPELWEQYNLIGVPTWVINEKTYPGVKSIKKLKELTGC